ncbi:transposase [Actinokineospora sp. G85]|uniref:transposase n=1 Tax=Actinokineospora sp. G85 TaxID=3406626 RepID=UPI003C71A4A2
MSSKWVWFVQSQDGHLVAARPTAVLADKGYSTRAVRAWPRARHIPTTIPEHRDHQVGRQRRTGGCPPVFDRVSYRRRGIVERRFNRLEQFRAIATLTPWLRGHALVGLC